MDDNNYTTSMTTKIKHGGQQRYNLCEVLRMAKTLVTLPFFFVTTSINAEAK